MPGSLGIKNSDVGHTHTKELVLRSKTVLYSPITCVQFCYGSSEWPTRIGWFKYAL